MANTTRTTSSGNPVKLTSCARAVTVQRSLGYNPALLAQPGERGFDRRRVGGEVVAAGGQHDRAEPGYAGSGRDRLLGVGVRGAGPRLVVALGHHDQQVNRVGPRVLEQVERGVLVAQCGVAAEQVPGAVVLVGGEVRPDARGAGEGVRMTEQHLRGAKPAGAPAEGGPVLGGDPEVPGDRLTDIGGEPGIGLRPMGNVGALGVPGWGHVQSGDHRHERLGLAGGDGGQRVARQVEGAEDTGGRARISRQRQQHGEGSLRVLVVLRRQPDQDLLADPRHPALHVQELDPPLASVGGDELTVLGHLDRAGGPAEQVPPGVIEDVGPVDPDPDRGHREHLTDQHDRDPGDHPHDPAGEPAPGEPEGDRAAEREDDQQHQQWCPGETQHRSQVPKISRSWLTSRNPFCSATALAHFSTAGPDTSTVRPQRRQTRWW